MSSNARQLCLTVFALLAIISFAQFIDLEASPVFTLRGVPQQSQSPSEQVPDTVTVQPSSAGRPVTVAVDKSRVRVGELVRFTLSPASIVADPKHSVTVDFGDDTRQDTRQTVVTHRYRAKGHYKVYASVVSPAFDVGPRDPQRPIPRVTLEARPTSVDANRPVRFTAQLSSSYPGLSYRFVFGDGSGTAWQESPTAIHPYENPGTYLAYVDLGLNDGGRIKQVGGSLRQSIIVNRLTPIAPIIPDPPDPRPEPQPGPVKLTANPTPVTRGQPVTLDARATSTNSSVRYRFVFGDGSSSSWQNDARAMHEYAKAGNYRASVNLGLMKSGRIRTLSNDSQGIQVTDSPASSAVDFEANPRPVSFGQPVNFNARVTPAEGNLRYRFFFGDDSSPTGWQTSPQTSYRYPKTGDYSAHVEIGRWTNGRVGQIATSSPKLISVTAGAISSASPRPSQTVPNASPSGTSFSGRTSDGPATSPSSPETPLAGLPDNWWLYLLIALLLIFVAYQIYQSLLAPRTTFHASRDPGSAEVEATAKGLEINSQVLLRPNISEAQYLVYSDDAIVKSVRRENV